MIRDPFLAICLPPPCAIWDIIYLALFKTFRLWIVILLIIKNVSFKALTQSQTWRFISKSVKRTSCRVLFEWPLRKNVKHNYEKYCFSTAGPRTTYACLPVYKVIAQKYIIFYKIALEAISKSFEMSWILHDWSRKPAILRTICSLRSVFLNLFWLEAPLASYISVWRHP